MKMSTYKKWMLESYLYEADDDWKKEKFKDPVSGEDKSIESGLSSPDKDTRQAAADARDKIKPKKGKEEPETKPDTTDQDSKAKEKGEEPSGEEPSGEEPSGEEPSDGEKPKKGVFDEPGSGKADDYLGGDDEEPSGEPEKTKREPVKVDPNAKTTNKGDVRRGAGGRFAAYHGYSGDGEGFDDSIEGHKAAVAWASGVHDTPEEAENSVKEPSGEPEGGEEVERDNAGVPENEQDWAEEIDQVQSDYEEMKDNYEQTQRMGDPDDPEEKEQMDLDRVEYINAKNKLRKYKKKEKEQGWDREMGRTGTEEIKVINGKKYRKIKESKHPLKEQYDRLFTNRTII